MKHILRKFLPLALALALLCALAPAALAEIEVTGITLTTAPAPSTIKVGETGTLFIIVELTGADDDEASPEVTADDVTATKKDGDVDIITFSGDGPQLTTETETSKTYSYEFVGVAEGETRITAQCGEKTSEPFTVTVEPDITVTGLTLDQETLTIPEVGATATLTATVTFTTDPEDTVKTPTLVWTIADEDVIEEKSTTSRVLTDPDRKQIQFSITVAALKSGSTKIGARCGGKTAECAVSSAPVAVTGVTLDKTSLSLVVDDTATLTAAVVPEDATDGTVRWAVSDETVVELTRNGLNATLKARAPGEATVTVTSADGARKAECAVKVVARVRVTDVTLNRATLSLSAGTTATLAATVVPGDATNRTVKWTLDDPEIAALSTETTQSGGSLTFTARKSGIVTVTATTEDGSKTARCEITITPPKIDSYSLGSNGRLDFSDSGLISTLRSYCRNITGSSLDYLTNITVSTAEGTLYEGYVSEADHGEGVSTSMKYYDSSIGVNQLSKVVFVPRPGYTGDAVITFTAYSSGGGAFTGNIVVEIPDNPLSYTSEDGLPVRFKAEDFTNYSRTRGYSTIKYVRFELPPSSYGTLYYNYIDSDINEGPVSYSTAYYRAGSPSLDKVWFVPNPSYSGNVTIRFEACDTSGATFSGSLLVQVVNVTGSSSPGASVSYSVRPGETVYFSTNDFNDLSYDLTDYPLNYLYFTSLPATSRGTLYCSGYGSVRTGQSIYRSGSSRRLVSDLYFTARDSYTGTVSLPFTAYATNGRSFRGTVTITVTSSATSSPTGQDTFYGTDSIITYSSGGEAVTFRNYDFYYQAARHLSNPLSTVRFYAPDAAQGRLCLYYVSPTNYSVLDYSMDYSVSTLSQISFLPRAGFSGAAYVRFLATDQSGKSYTGLLAVNVTPPSYSSYFDDLGGYSWAAPAADFLARYGIVTGTDYRAFSPAGLTKRGDFILMLQRCFEFQNVGEIGVFTDVSPWSYYGPAIAGAYVAGFATGDGDGSFRPEAPLTRQEAAVLLYRCMARSGSMPSVTMADIAGFADQAQIADYAQTAMATLVRLGVLTGSGGYLNPTQYLTRAEMALIFHRALS